jgi:hypothetical protein
MPIHQDRGPVNPQCRSEEWKVFSTGSVRLHDLLVQGFPRSVVSDFGAKNLRTHSSAYTRHCFAIASLTVVSIGLWGIDDSRVFQWDSAPPKALRG